MDITVISFSLNISRPIGLDKVDSGRIIVSFLDQGSRKTVITLTCGEKKKSCTSSDESDMRGMPE